MRNPLRSIFENYAKVRQVRSLRWSATATGKPQWVKKNGEISASFGTLREGMSFLSRLSLADILAPKHGYIIWGARPEDGFTFFQNTDDPKLQIRVVLSSGCVLEDSREYPTDICDRPCMIQMPLQRLDLDKLESTVATEQAFLHKEELRPDSSHSPDAPALEKTA